MEVIDTDSEAGDRLVAALMRFKPDHLSPNAWAVQAGLGRSLWSDLRRHGNPSRRTLERLLTVIGSSLAEFEALRTDLASHETAVPDDGLSDPNWGWRGRPLPPLNCYTAAVAGSWGESELEAWAIDLARVSSHVPRPPSLAEDREAFATNVVGSAMTPRFPTGRLIAASPDRPLLPGSDILVQLRRQKGKSSNLWLPGRFVGHHGEALIVGQYDKDRRGDVAADLIERLVVIIGELI